MQKTLPALTFALVLALLAPAARAADTTSGAVESAAASHVTVSGRTYAIHTDTELLDRGGHRIAVEELAPGTPVDLDIDDDGNLATLRATLVR